MQIHFVDAAQAKRAQRAKITAVSNRAKRARQNIDWLIQRRSRSIGDGQFAVIAATFMLIFHIHIHTSAFLDFFRRNKSMRFARDFDQ